MSNMDKIKPPKIDPIQKHINDIIAIIRRRMEKEFEPRVRARIKEYMDKYMPELETSRIELTKKIEHYDKMTNKFKAIFTPDEYKSILMCLHPDGERSKEKLEEVFVLFKKKESQLTKK